jgi:hypothetical protein
MSRGYRSSPFMAIRAGGSGNIASTRVVRRVPSLGAGRAPTVLARNKLNARQLASPAIAGGRLFIRADDVLYAIGK